MPDGKIWPVAVIGAGVVGCAITRALALGGVETLLLEKGADILSGASKGNSALLHTGFDAPPGSLELHCMRAGYAEYLRIRDSLNLPLLETGAHVVAWNAEEAAKLGHILAIAQANGVGDVAEIPLARLYEREPALAPGAVAALEVPGEHAIDPWSAPLAYALHALAHGATVLRGAEAVKLDFDGGAWRIETPRGIFAAAVVVNAAGLYGDWIEGFVRTAPFRIRPRRGQFIVFDKSAASLVKSILLPVPTARSKGVLVCPTIFGNILVGPTAEETEERDAARVTQDALKALLAAAHARVPALADHAVTAIYAGLRPATEQSEYIIEALPDRRWITVAGIRSTGLTSALGIAAYVRDLYAGHFGELRPPAQITPTPVPNLAQHLPRGVDGPNPGEIVCHCELVTRREIEAALSGPLPAGDMGGLKRRTRATMGRCQGFYCQARVAALAPLLMPEAPK
jgi:glycerol-3-phosphate dehydrogenase